MRHLAFGARRSGRTTILAHEIVNDLSCHDRDVYVVASSFRAAMEVRHTIKSINEEYGSRIRALSVHSLHTLRGTDARNIYFEHTAYEEANSEQLIEIYRFEDRKAEIIWGVP